VTAEAVMLTCVIDAQENRDVAVVDIPNAFVQTVVSDEDAEHRVMVRIRGPLVDILVSMAPDVYGPYVSVTKTGQKVLIVECLNAVYGTMVAAYYATRSSSRASRVKRSSSIRMMGVWLTRLSRASRLLFVSMWMTARYLMRSHK
jgi:hypothetical protein